MAGQAQLLWVLTALSTLVQLLWVLTALPGLDRCNCQQPRCRQDEKASKLTWLVLPAAADSPLAAGAG